MQLSTIRAGLATRLATISGLRVEQFVPETANPPCAFIGAPTVTFDDDFNGSCTVRFPVLVLVSAADMKRGQDALDDYIDTTGSKSVRAALDADPDLAGAAQSVRLTGVDTPQLYTFGEQSYVGASFTVEVYAA